MAAGWGLRCPAAAAGLDRMYACKRSTGPLDGLPGLNRQDVEGQPVASEFRAPACEGLPAWGHCRREEKVSTCAVGCSFEHPMAHLHCNSLHADKPLDCNRTGEKISGKDFYILPGNFLGLHMPNLVID